MKEKFFKSTLILLIGGLLTKILGMIIKIVIARKIGTRGIGMYMLILPTFSLFINLSQFGLPIAMSKLISEESKDSKKLFFSVLPILIIINILLMIIILILAPFISKTLLHNEETTISIMSMAFVIPFTSISSICRSYFFGKEKMTPHVISNITEDLVRLIIINYGIDLIKPLGLNYSVCFLVLSNVISEITSTLVLILFLPKKIEIKRNDFHPNKQYIKESLEISIPNTSSRIIGNIAYFLEPIILTTILHKVGYSSTFITKEYGILSGYVLPLLLLPSFFTMAISQAILPIISKEYKRNNLKQVSNKIRQAIILSLGVALPITICFIINPKIFLKKIYHTEHGINYTRFLAPICLLEYFQAPLSTSLIAMGKNKDALKANLISTISRTTLLIILSFLKIGLWSLVISISINIILTTIYEYYKIKSYL